MAEKREDWNEKGMSDKFRPLTKKGIQRFTDVALGLSLFVPQIDIIVTSELTRAVQTAEILHAQYKQATLQYSQSLNPDSTTTVLQAFIDRQIETKIRALDNFTIAFIGHQVELATLTSLLLTGSKTNKEDYLKYKKGGASMLSLNQNKSELLWLKSGRQIVEFAALQSPSK